MIHIVTDSSALVTKEEQATLPITVVPLSVTIGKKTYQDSVNIDGETSINKIADHPEVSFSITS